MQIAREPRRKVLIRATMRAGGPRADVCIRDVSAHGMMVQAAMPPPRGTFVDLEWGDQQIVGLVIWRRERRFGIQIRDRIAAHALASRVQSQNAASGRVAPGRWRTAAGADAGAGRSFAARLEFGIVAIFAAALVCALALTIFHTLSRPFASISAMLGG
jgi:hypothetical protein